jgi:transposase
MLQAFLPGAAMSKRRFEMFHYRQVLVRMRQGDSDRDIARSNTMGRRKAAQIREVAEERGWLAPGVPLPDDATLAAAFARREGLPASCLSSLEPWRDQITAWHHAGIQGTTIHAALTRNHGYTGSYSSVHRFVSQLIRAVEPAVPLRLVFRPAEAAQVDFGAGPVLTDARSGETFKTWFFVMTLCWSRHQYVELVRDQSCATWLACHRHAFEGFGGAVERVIIDNPKCAITRACAHDPEVQRAYAEYAEGYGFKIDPCPPRDPAKKGIVEAGVKYVKRAFLPLREFRSLADANRQAAEWVRGAAGNRCHGTTREKPLTRFLEVERALLRPLPAVPPVLAVWAKVKVHRDAHVQFEHGLYSVPFRLVGQTLWLKAGDGLVSLYRDHEQVASHPRQSRPGARSTVPDHLPPAALAWSLHDTQWCLREAQRIGPRCQALLETWFADQVLVNLRAAQGVLRLEKTYGTTRLEAACTRALRFGSARYRTVKNILAKGLDAVPAPALETSVPATYTQGGRFCRDSKTLLH